MAVRKVKSLMMFSRFNTISACDGQTDILRQHSPRCAYASGGDNPCQFRKISGSGRVGSRFYWVGSGRVPKFGPACNSVKLSFTRARCTYSFGLLATMAFSVAVVALRNRLHGDGNMALTA